MIEELLAYLALLHEDLISRKEYESHLDELFSKDFQNDLLIELECCLKNKEKSLQIIKDFYHQDMEGFDQEAFCCLLLAGLKKAYYLEGTSLLKFGRKAYSLWKALPSDLRESESLKPLCYGDDPISWGDERQSREIYEELFEFAGNRNKT